MSLFKKLLGVLLCAALMLTALTACGEGTKTYTVEFDTDGGSAVASQKVEEGAYATRPEDPEKDGMAFGDWFADKSFETAFSFETEAVTENMTLYASWVDLSNASKATFYWNYEGAAEEVYATKYFENNKRVSAPAAPDRGSDYYFAGWYAEDGTAFSAMKKYTGDQSFYAKWQTVYTFEAEDTQLTGFEPNQDGTVDGRGNKIGHGYSSDFSGKSLIGGADCGASGGAYITGLFYNGAYLDFEIHSDVAVTDAVLRLSLSCEFSEITLTDKTFLVLVNGESCDFSDIRLTGGSLADTTSTTRAPFREFYIGVVSLNAGDNVIRLQVNNSEAQFDSGTVKAAAPMIDYVRIYSSSALTMTKYENK